MTLASLPSWTWLMLAGLSFWAIRLIIDEFLITENIHGDSIYKESIYGTIISGRFAGYVSVPLIIGYVWLGKYNGNLLDIVQLFLSGLFFLLHYHFFFILLKGDKGTNAAWTETISSGHLVVTPFILFLVFGERFNLIIIIGIIVVGLSLTAVYLRTADIIKNNFEVVAAFITSFSISTVLTDSAYEGYTDLNVIVTLMGFFYLGMGVCGHVIFWVYLTEDKRHDVNHIIKQRFKLFSLAELVDLSGSFFVQLAIAAAPTAVVIAATLQFLPVVCMFYAVIILIIFKDFHIRAIAYAQLKEGVVKIFASIFTFVGAILIIGSNLAENFLRNYFSGN